MIQRIYLVQLAKDDSQFRELSELFSALGLEADDEWQGRANKGVLFRTPQAAIEVGLGAEFPGTDLLFEVQDANAAYELVKARGFKIAEEISDRKFGGRMFVVEAAGHQVGIFSYLPEKAPQHPKPIEGALDSRGKRFGIVVSRFNSFITERLMQGALDALHRTGAKDSDIEIVRVPGAYEIPSAARMLAETRRFDAVICIGCLIRGETLHYEVIANEVGRGVGQSAQDTGVPHAFGVLTVENLEQAIDRAGLKAGNKGFEAGLAAVEMANVKEAVSGQRSAASK
jgi:6,7-dimethyl-8-ribityllumazine synthase